MGWLSVGSGGPVEAEAFLPAARRSRHVAELADFNTPARTRATVGGGTPVFTGVFEPVARGTLYLTDENGCDSSTCFGAA